MNYLLQYYSSDELIVAHDQAKQQVEHLKLTGDVYDHLIEFMQDINEILNHRGARIKL
jgi:hypothetical protein